MQDAHMKCACTCQWCARKLTALFRTKPPFCTAAAQMLLHCKRWAKSDAQLSTAGLPWHTVACQANGAQDYKQTA